jgi:REP element-mobilizing transposase RayT
VPGLKTYYRRHLPHYQPEGETYHVVFRLAGSIAASVLEKFRCERERYEVQANGTKNESDRLRFLRQYRRKYLERIESMLDGNTRGPFWLNKPEIAAIVDEAIRYRDANEYDLIAHTIMPNHVHLIVTNVRWQNEISPVSRTDCPTDTSENTDCPTDTPDNADGPTDTAEGGGRRATYFDYPLSNVLRKLKWNTALRANKVLGRSGAFWHPESYDRVIRDGGELERTIRYVLMNPVNAGLCKDWRDWKWTYVKEGYIRD